MKLFANVFNLKFMNWERHFICITYWYLYKNNAKYVAKLALIKSPCISEPLKFTLLLPNLAYYFITLLCGAPSLAHVTARETSSEPLQGSACWAHLFVCFVCNFRETDMKISLWKIWIFIWSNRCRCELQTSQGIWNYKRSEYVH